MRLFIISLLSDIRRLPRPVYILVFGQFLNRFGSFVYPFLTLFLQDKAYGLGQIGGVLAAISHGNFFGPMAGGYLADAGGRYRPPKHHRPLSYNLGALFIYPVFII